MASHALALDMRKGGTVRERVTVRLGESRTQKVAATLTDGGAPYAPACDSARLLARMEGGARIDVAATVSDATATATLPVEALDAPDRSRVAYIQLEWSDGRTETTEDFDLIVLNGGTE